MFYSLKLSSINNNNKCPVSSYLAVLFYFNYNFKNKDELLTLINTNVYKTLSQQYTINKIKLIDETPIEYGSLVKKNTYSNYNILTEKERKNIYSYHIRTEYIRDELL